MPGSDIMVYEAAANSVTDYFALAYARPTMDACASDWAMQGEAVLEDGLVAVRLVRALDTGDAQDRVLMNDADLTGPATAIIAAWRNEASLSFHGDNRARSIVRFFSPPTTEEPTSEAVTARTAALEDQFEDAASRKLQDLADGSFVVYEPSDYIIPTAETTYFSNCINVTEYLTQRANRCRRLPYRRRIRAVH
jgi:hypothetical protein